MPWDGCELWLAGIDAAGRLHDARRIAGGRDESVQQPLWSPDGRLLSLRVDAESDTYRLRLDDTWLTPASLQVRGVVDAPVASESPADSGAPAFDCASTMIEYTDDASALAVGFASRSVVTLAG